MDLRRLLLKIDADVTGAILGLGKVSDGLGQTEEGLDKVSKKAKASSDDLVREFSKYSSAFYRLVGLFEMGGARIKQAFEMAAEGSRIMAAQSFFENAGRSIEDLRKATSNLISDAELMKKANLADSMGISMDTFKSLAKVAQASAYKTGQSFDYMFESIIVGTARSSRLLLDNLGIIVSVKEANESYARGQLKLQGIQNATNAEINAYVEAMDDNAKKTAFAEEVQRKAQGTIGEMGSAATGTAERFDSLSTAVDNLNDTLKKGMAEASKDFATDLDKTIRLYDKLIQRVGFLEATSLGAWEAFKNTILFPGGLAGQGAAFETGAALSEAFKPFEEQSIRSKELLNQRLQSELGSLASLMGTQDIGKAIIAVSEYMATGKTVNSAMEEQIKTIIWLNKMLGGYIKKREIQEPPAGPRAGAKGAGKKAAKKVEDEIEGFDFSDLREEVDRANKEFEDLINHIPSIQDLARETERLAKASEMAKIKLVDLAYELAKPIADAIGSAISTIASGGGLFRPLTGLADTLLEEQGGIGGAVSSALSGAGMGAMAAGPLGAAIGVAVGIVSDILDSLKPVKSIIESIVAMFKVLIGTAFGPLLDILVPLFQALVPFVAGLSLVIRGLIDPFVDTLRPIIDILALFLNALTIPLTLFAILANMIFAVVQMVGSLFGLLSPAFAGIHEALSFFQNMVIDAAINLNNALIGLIRMIPGLAEFGTMLTKEDFLGPQEDNTEAVKENTRAIRDLAREFRNMPSGYKVNRTIYEAASPELDRRSLRSVYSNDINEAFRSNPRWRT